MYYSFVSKFDIRNKRKRLLDKRCGSDHNSKRKPWYKKYVWCGEDFYSHAYENHFTKPESKNILKIFKKILKIFKKICVTWKLHVLNRFSDGRTESWNEG